MTSKVCSKCLKRRPLDAFSKYGNEDRRRSECKMCVKAYAHGIYLKNSKKIKVRSALWAKKNKKKVALICKRSRDSMRSRCLEHYGDKCNCCGERRKEFLTIDHIRGDGAKHRREIGNDAIYRWLIKKEFPKGRFRILCYNCNCSRGKYGYCPHEKEKKCGCTSLQHS
jgi:hypothetical protein